MKNSLMLFLKLTLSVLIIASVLLTGCVQEPAGPAESQSHESPVASSEPQESSPEGSVEESSPESAPESKPSESTPAESEPIEPDPPSAVPVIWSVGFAYREIELPETPKTPLYIAGYNQGVTISKVRDLQRANALWIDAEDEAGGMLIISIDCVGLASKYVNEIRSRLSDFTEEVGCVAVNVVSTHTHAGLDTFGLWGPEGVDGKNAEFMENLVSAAVEAAKAAYDDRSDGIIYHSYVTTDTSFLRDSRYPLVLDPNLYQLRFEPNSNDKNGIRVVSYGAHAESMRGANTILSRDYPGELGDIVKETTGDDMLYLPGPLGGLVMTQEIVSPFDAVKNLEATGKKLADYLLSIKRETVLPSYLSFVSEPLEVPVENTVFKLYKTLGILDNEIYEANGQVIVKSEIGLISLGGKDGILCGLIPGEMFPELVIGTGLKSSDPTALSKLAANAGYKNLITVNLANDELGYIVPPSDFIVHPTNPYFQRYEVNGEDHYEETNSVGKLCAAKIAEAFASALSKLG